MIWCMIDLDPRSNFVRRFLISSLFQPYFFFLLSCSIEMKGRVGCFFAWLCNYSAVSTMPKHGGVSFSTTVLYVFSQCGCHSVAQECVSRVSAPSDSRMGSVDVLLTRLWLRGAAHIAFRCFSPTIPLMDIYLGYDCFAGKYKEKCKNK